MDLTQLKSPARTRRDKLLSFLPAAAWYGVICAFSAQTGEESGKLSGALVDKSIDWMGGLGELFQTDWDAFLFLSFLFRKAAHMGIFFLLCALLLYGLWRLDRPRLPLAGAALAITAALAALDEFHQTFVPGREGKLRDVLIDTAGGVCFLLLRWIWLRVRRRPSARGPV